MNFKNSLFNEYPIVQSLSIWSGNPYGCAIGSIDSLIELCVEELASDVMITDYIQATGMVTYMPADTVSVSNVQLSFMFQGNKYVKFMFDKMTKTCQCRFYPSTICFRRKMRVSDLDNLSGDLLIYTRAFMLWKMAEKELVNTSIVKLSTDIGSIDTSSLSAFMETQKNIYSTMKPEIHLYTSTF